MMSDPPDLDPSRSLFTAVITNNQAYLSQLLRAGDISWDSASSVLPLAVREGHSRVVEMLVGAGCPLGSVDVSDVMWHRRPIHIAAAKGHLNIIKILIENGEDIDVEDMEMGTALNWAATEGRVHVVKYLLEQGAAINVGQSDGFTALHSATCMRHLTTCSLLLEHGADVNCVDKEGWTPLHAAACYGSLNILDLYLKAGANIHQKSIPAGETPLYIAVNSGDLNIIDTLVKSGATLDDRDINGYTAFYYSVLRSKFSVSKYLVDMGADVNIKDQTGYSAMYLATVRANKLFIELLISAGSDLQKEAYIRKDQLPVTLGNQRELSKWLTYLATNPYELKYLCRLAIRKHLGQRKKEKSKLLPLPVKIQDFVGGCG